MTRPLPFYHRELQAASQEALGIVAAGEISRSTVAREWKIHRLEALYELAFLRIFGAWEQYLEAIFLRSLCGYASRSSQEVLQNNLSYFRNLQSAEAAMLGAKQYKLWHNPNVVVQRCKQFIDSSGRGPALQERTIASNLAFLEQLAAIRHRIAHSQKDAKNKFDAASVSITSRTYRGSRPGRLLRDWDPSTNPRRRWIHTFEQSLIGLLSQMV